MSILTSLKLQGCYIWAALITRMLVNTKALLTRIDKLVLILQLNGDRIFYSSIQISYYF